VIELLVEYAISHCLGSQDYFSVQEERWSYTHVRDEEELAL
jgi:hypothetical protein